MNPLEYESPRSRVPRPMRIQLLVLLVWLPMSMVGMLLGLYACVQYNRVAGTDLTKTEMTFITVSMNTGPFVGPLQGRNAFDDFYGKLCRWRSSRWRGCRPCSCGGRSTSYGEWCS